MLWLKIFLLVICVTVCHGAAVPDITTPSSFTDITTENYDKTDLAQEVIDEALNIDDGRYTTQLFQYQNAQKESVKGNYNDTCIDSYIDCILNQVMPIEVCAWNKKFGYLVGADGYWNAATYCDVQLDNCRRGYRVWRIIGYGFCKTEGPYWRIRSPQRYRWGSRPVWNDDH